MSSFTDEKPRVATEKEVKAPWGGGANGKWFRCYLCGYKFKVGDMWRWVFGKGKCVNFITCEACDGDDVMERWIALGKEYHSDKFWWFKKD